MFVTIPIPSPFEVSLYGNQLKKKDKKTQTQWNSYFITCKQTYIDHIIIFPSFVIHTFNTLKIGLAFLSNIHHNHSGYSGYLESTWHVWFYNRSVNWKTISKYRIGATYVSIMEGVLCTVKVTTIMTKRSTK